MHPQFMAENSINNKYVPIVNVLYYSGFPVSRRGYITDSGAPLALGLQHKI